MNTPSFTEQKVISKDGTSIAVQKSGDGPALLLVHGTGADRSRWTAVIPLLAQYFTVYSMDRRGRGGSGDAATYTFEREYEDIAAVANSIPGPVDVLGHSFGAACVLGAVPHISNLRRLIIYEPPMLREQHSPRRTEILEQMDQALASGDRDTVVMIMMRDMLNTPAPIIERARATPAWAGSTAAAHTFTRELRSSDVYGANPDILRQITHKTLFLLGENSMESFKLTTETLGNLLLDNEVRVLPGQQHSAMLTAPGLFAEEVIRFLTA
jgi:pimeloyl-ACP methyl ester carboxylesterase